MLGLGGFVARVLVGGTVVRGGTVEPGGAMVVGGLTLAILTPVAGPAL